MFELIKKSTIKSSTSNKKAEPQKKEKISLTDLAKKFYPDDITFEEFGTCGENAVFAGMALGDIAASAVDSGTSHIRPEGPLFKDGLSFSGNTVLADAVIFGAKKLFMDGIDDKRMMRLLYTNVLKRAYASHPDAGYEADFERWASGKMREDEAKMYQSAECSSAVRALPIGAMFDTPDDVITYAMMSAMPTHAHPEGIKGAVVAAMCLFLLSHEASKSDVLRYAKRHYPGSETDISADTPLTALELGGSGKNSAKCIYVVPAALVCFFNSSSFDDCVRNALSIEGDNATIASIAGGLAAAYYGKTVEDADEILRRFGVDDI